MLHNLKDVDLLLWRKISLKYKLKKNQSEIYLCSIQNKGNWLRQNKVNLLKKKKD